MPVPVLCCTRGGNARTCMGSNARIHVNMQQCAPPAAAMLANTPMLPGSHCSNARTYTNTILLPLQLMHASKARHLLFPAYFHGSNICTCISSNAHAHVSTMLQPCTYQHQKQCMHLCQQQCVPTCQHHAAPFAAMLLPSLVSMHAPTGSLPIRMNVQVLEYSSCKRKLAVQHQG